MGPEFRLPVPRRRSLALALGAGACAAAAPALVLAREGGETAPVAGGSYLDAADTLKTLKIVSEQRRERARHIGFRFVVEPGVD